MPDQSKGRTPLGEMTNDEIYRSIYRPAIDGTPDAFDDDDTCQGRRRNPNAKQPSLWWLLWPASVAAGVAVWVWLS